MKKAQQEYCTKHYGHLLRDELERRLKEYAPDLDCSWMNAAELLGFVMRAENGDTSTINWLKGE